MFAFKCLKKGGNIQKIFLWRYRTACKTSIQLIMTRFLKKYHRYIQMFPKNSSWEKKMLFRHAFNGKKIGPLRLHHRSGSTHTIFFCSSQMMLRRLVSREAWSHQDSGATLWYRHGSLSSSGSSFFEHASSCTSDWPWRWSFDLKSEINHKSSLFFVFF